MNNETEKKLDQFLAQAAPVLRRAEGIVPPERGRKALQRLLDSIFPVARELTVKEMEALLLRVLKEQGMTSYALAERFENADIKLKDAGEGLLLGILAELEYKGHLRGEWRESGDQMIKIYRSTEKGEAFLRASTVQASTLKAWCDLVLSFS